MPELDAERRERLAAEIAKHASDMSDEQKIDGVWTWGLCCDCGDFVPGGELDKHIADALAPLVAGWLADDTAVCATCQHRGGDDQPAQHPGCAAALGRIRAAALREAAREAEERGDIGKDGGPEAWEWLRGLIQRAEIDREIGGTR